MNHLKTLALIAAMAFAIPTTAQAKAEETCLSETAVKACEEAGEKYSICPELLMSIIERESSGKPEAVNGNCKGLMQVNEKIHKGRMEKLGATDLFDEEQNILVGADYLAELFAEYEDVAVVLSKYHGEKDGIRKAEQGILSDYVIGILDRSAELERKHGK